MDILCRLICQIKYITALWFLSLQSENDASTAESVPEEAEAAPPVITIETAATVEATPVSTNWVGKVRQEGTMYSSYRWFSAKLQ